jgi:hypothetical protein
MHTQSGAPGGQYQTPQTTVSASSGAAKSTMKNTPPITIPSNIKKQMILFMKPPCTYSNYRSISGAKLGMSAKSFTHKGFKEIAVFELLPQ